MKPQYLETGHGKFSQRSKEICKLSSWPSTAVQSTDAVTKKYFSIHYAGYGNADITERINIINKQIIAPIYWIKEFP